MCPAALQEWEQPLGICAAQAGGEDGLTCRLSLQVSLRPGRVLPLRLLRAPVRAGQPGQPDAAQHALLPAGLLPGIW